MSKLENKRRRAASKGIIVAKMRENKLSDETHIVVWQAVVYRPYSHVYVYDMVANDGSYMVVRPNDIKPLAGLTYRQAVQLAYMLAFRRKGF